MDATEVRADQTGSGDPLECDERHYVRFLRRVLPGPERARGKWVCDVCGRYFDEGMAGVKEEDAS